MSIGERIGFQGLIVAASLLAAACSNPPPPEVPVADVPPPSSAAPPGEPEPPGEARSPIEIKDSPRKRTAKPVDGPGSDKENPVMRCGPHDSYELVADHECPDGTRPLGGDARAGAAARSGNVGANSTGHIIDRYVVPCSDGPVEIYVDMYGCP